MPEEDRRGQRRNIRLREKFENAKTLQNHLVYHSRDENNHQMQRFLCEKLQGARNKQNTSPRMRSVAAENVTAQLNG